MYVQEISGPKRDMIEETGGRFFSEYLKHEGLFEQYFSQILEILNPYQRQGRLLDVGCGIGTFLRVARSRGWDVTGLDLSVASVEYAKQTGLDVRQTRIEDVDPSAESYDVVTIFQTIEHMEDPVAVLVNARSLLKPGGVLVLTTPNRESLLGKILGNRWFGYYNEEHLFFFNKPSFETTVEKAGFEILITRVDQGKPLTLSWVFIRLADYYYNHRKFARDVLTILRKVSRLFDWLKIREPMVDLIIVARVPSSR